MIVRCLLKESLLMNFTHPAEPEGDCVLGESKEAPVLVIQHGDGKAATREIQKERKSKRRTSLTTGQTVEVSRASSISNSSANSSASVSPRSGADVKLKPPSTSSSISADLDISASYRHRTKETLSASSRTLCQNGSPGLSPRSKSYPCRYRTAIFKVGSTCLPRTCQIIQQLKITAHYNVFVHIYISPVATGHQLTAYITWVRHRDFVFVRNVPLTRHLQSVHSSLEFEEYCTGSIYSKEKLIVLSHTLMLAENEQNPLNLILRINLLEAVPEQFMVGYRALSKSTTNLSDRHLNLRPLLPNTCMDRLMTLPVPHTKKELTCGKRLEFGGSVVDRYISSLLKAYHHETHSNPMFNRKKLWKTQLIPEIPNHTANSTPNTACQPSNVAVNSLPYLDGKLHLMRMIRATGDLADDRDIPLGI
ncbi:hypothetical protein CLF_100552 [Clonorchis sinensis]|uniref:Uncharacterized protein n=1 Tax=Clonorchis sinensis TaxID=79923 RepID=G7Y3Q2_CLOSI|nr:hypothetical protein CLF_100552 [Clonorchis sinensis]